MRESDTGVYDVLLSNPYGSVATKGCALVVRAGLPLPTAATDVLTWRFYDGGVLSLPTSFPTPSGLLGRWQHDGQWVSPATTNYSNLLINGLSASDAGVYRFVLSNGLASVVVTEITLIVLPTPSPTSLGIGTQPTDFYFTEIWDGATSVICQGQRPFTYEWRKNGTAVPGATNDELRCVANRPDQAGTYTCVVRNAYGSVETAPIVARFLSVRVPPEKPVIADLPARVLGSGDALGLTSSKLISPISADHYQWRRNGVAVGSDSMFFSKPSISVADAGRYTVVYSNDYGSTESDPLEIRVVDATQPPVVSGPAVAVTATLNGQFNFRAPVVARGSVTYRWFLNGREVTADNIVTGLSDGYLVQNAQPFHSGVWTVQVSNSAGAVTTPAANVQVQAAPLLTSARLGNVSTRAVAGQGSSTLILGFNLSGTASKRMLLRAVGPTLSTFGISPSVQDPRLMLYRGNTLVASNDDWFRQPNVAGLAVDQRNVGAFALQLPGADAALVATLTPGAYTLQYVNDGATPNTIGLIEAYDLDLGYPAARITNLSSRLFVGPGQQAAIPGITVTGSGSKTYLIRAVGPGPAKFGLTGVLDDPQITLTSDRPTTKFSNDNWESAPDRAALTAASDRAGAFALGAGSKDAALLLTLAPGSYTAVVTGAGTSSGIVLVEVYEMP